MVDYPYVLAGGIAGLVVGLTGIGAGALMTPILLLFFGVSPTTEIATNLWFAAITKIAGAFIHYQSGQVDWQVVKRLWLGSLPTALVIALLVSSGVMIAKVSWLTTIIGILVIVTSLGLWFAPKLSWYARHRRIDNPSRFKNWQPLFTVISGMLLGICVALTSIGAGTLGSLLLLYLYPLRMVPHKLVATDIVHAIPLAIVAGTGYLIAGKVDELMLFNLLLGSIPAAILGSFLSHKFSGRNLQIFLASILFLVGLKIIS